MENYFKSECKIEMIINLTKNSMVYCAAYNSRETIHSNY